MDRETRIAWLVDHYRRPRHRGELEDADVRVPAATRAAATSSPCTSGRRTARTAWRRSASKGWAARSARPLPRYLAERTNRQKPTFEEVLAFSYEQMLDLLGRDIASSRPGCAMLALGTLKAAVKTVEMNRALRAAGHTEEEIRELRRAIAAQAERTGLVLGEGAERAALAGAAPLPDLLARR